MVDSQLFKANNKHKNIINSYNNNLKSWFLALLLFLQIPPFYIWGSKIVVLTVFFCAILFLTEFEFKKKALACFISLVLLYFYCGYKNEYNIIGLAFLFCIPLLFSAKEKLVMNGLEKFVLIYSVALIPSLIVYLLVNVFGITIPFLVIEPLNALKSYQYFQYPFLVQEDGLFLILPRFHAYFDEPGVVGTISGLLLALDKFNMKKWVNIPILISGIISFSFVFYCILLVVGFIFLKNKYRIIFVIFLFIILRLFEGIDEFDQYIYSRFLFEDGELIGDNRTIAEFDIWYNNFKETNDYYWGMGQNSSLKYNFGGASYKDLIVDFGIIFFILYCMFFVVLGIVNLGIKKNLLLALFLFVAVIYQRPFITNFFYAFLMYIPFIYLKPDFCKVNTIIKNEHQGTG